MHLGEVGGADRDLAQQPLPRRPSGADSVAAGLREVEPGDDAEARREHLQEHRHQARQQHDPEQRVAEAASRPRGRWPSCPGPCSRRRPGSPGRGSRAAGAARTATKPRVRQFRAAGRQARSERAAQEPEGRRGREDIGGRAPRSGWPRSAAIDVPRPGTDRRACALAAGPLSVRGCARRRPARPWLPCRSARASRRAATASRPSRPSARSARTSA